MIGYPQFFVVPEGHNILKHPLYLKYNLTTIGSLDPDGVKADLAGIMATNDNMGIIWYLSNLIDAINRTK